MDASQLQRIDVNILLGIVNEKLRLECDSLAELQAYYGLDQGELSDRLLASGYRYDPLNNQFKSL
ncbi:DUF4250 domain-containing protein [Aeromonas simiae]|uniref:DUF4250 domain-containing protein n=1 Tax=Aeromonas simiae TaxID=218936 RepID=UPI0038D027CD